jgi:hypothetical protein
MNIQYGRPYIEIKNGRVAIARNWQNGSSNGVERAENSDDLERQIIHALRRQYVDQNALNGSYPATSELIALARFPDSHQDDGNWIPLSEASKLTQTSISGLYNAISRGNLDLRVDTSGPKHKKLVRREQVLEIWPPKQMKGSGNRLRTVGKLLNMTDKQVTSARFWQKVDQSAGAGQCWPWTGGKTGRGYGLFWLNGKPQPAHRVAYELANNTTVAPGEFVRHKPICNNIICCNPTHLLKSKTNR